MIAALMLGREGSTGFPGKNVYPVLGRPLMAYPLIAARNALHVDEIYVSTDSEKIKEIGRSYGISRERVRQLEARAFEKVKRAVHGARVDGAAD